MSAFLTAGLHNFTRNPGFAAILCYWVSDGTVILQRNWTAPAEFSPGWFAIKRVPVG